MMHGGSVLKRGPTPVTCFCLRLVLEKPPSCKRGAFRSLFFEPFEVVGGPGWTATTWRTSSSRAAAALRFRSLQNERLESELGPE